MRKIRFRAWDARNGRFVYVGIEHGVLCTDAVKDFPFGSLDDWQQLTGLLDKNEKEIYEGDIVTAKDQYGDLQRGEVCWKRFSDCCVDGMTWMIRDDEKISKRTLGNMYDIEIIGNIYENPDLMK